MARAAPSHDHERTTEAGIESFLPAVDGPTAGWFVQPRRFRGLTDAGSDAGQAPDQTSLHRAASLPPAREQARAGSDAPPIPLVASAARRHRALEAVEDQVQPERELDIVVARAEHALVARGDGQLGDVRVAGRHRLRQRG